MLLRRHISFRPGCAFQWPSSGLAVQCCAALPARPARPKLTGQKRPKSGQKWAKKQAKSEGKVREMHCRLSAAAPKPKPKPKPKLEEAQQHNCTGKDSPAAQVASWQSQFVCALSQFVCAAPLCSRTLAHFSTGRCQSNGRPSAPFHRLGVASCLLLVASCC